MLRALKKGQIESHWNKVKQAFAMGQDAFHRGLKAAPALDTAFMKSMSPAPIGENTVFLNAWLEGWACENLKD